MGSSLAYPGIQDLIISTQQLWSSSKITAAIAAAVDPTLKTPEAFAPAGTYPVTYDGAAVEKGDTFRMTGAGTMGAVTVNAEDLLIALIDTPAQVDANWTVVESNRDQATETVKGVAKLATQVIADAGTNDTDIMTALKTATAPVRAHDIDPAAGPHTGGLPEADSEFDDATGHAHTGAGGNGTVIAHSDTSGQGTDDHHAEAHDIDPAAGPHTGGLPEASAEFDDATGHAHTGAGGNGTVIAHSDTSGQGADDHHAQIHASSHENGGGDEISVAGLSGELADDQPPKAHASDHTDGTDDIQNATAAQKGLATAAQITLLEKLENMPVNTQTGTSYTPVLTDANKWVWCENASPFAFTIPTNAAVAFPIGTAFPVVRGGAGSLTFDHAGVTVYGELVITEQYFVAVCKKIDTDTWIIVGGTGGATIPESLFDANTVLKADTDDTPAALTVPEQTVVGRITAGVITALTATQIRTLINVADGADVTGSNAPQAHASSHENGGGDEISVAGLSGELADDQPPKAHASDHTDGTDDIQNATAAQKGLATAAQITKLDGVEALADVTFNKIQEETYNTSETDTGRAWNGSTLYMKSFTGTVPSGVADLISGGIAELVEVRGWANNGGVRNVCMAYHDGANQAYVFRDTGSSDLSIFGAGAFIGQAYKITCYYTKT